jgi:hypothetical protein
MKKRADISELLNHKWINSAEDKSLNENVKLEIAHSLAAF